MRCFHQFTRTRKGLVSATVRVLALGVLSASSATAALLFHDDFDYPVGEELGEPGSSSQPPWENSKDQITIAEGSLDYPKLQTSTDNRVQVESGLPSLDSVRTVTGAWKEQAGGKLYLSFLLRVESVAGIGSTGEGTSLLTIGHTSNNSQLLGINLLNDGAVRLGVLKYPSIGDSVSSSAFFSAGPGANLSADGSTTYLIVARYEWVEGATNDVVTLWLNPTGLGKDEDTRSKVSVDTGRDGFKSAGRLNLSRGPNVSLDELRIGHTWKDVTPTVGPPYRWMVMVGVLACSLVAATLWITQLRRKVAERSVALKTQIKERQKIEQQRLMDQERARIARDLHDELGADITEISMLATRAQGDSGPGGEGRQCLDQMAGKTRQMVGKLEEIVWAMNPQHDSLGALVSYFSFFADRFLGLANIKLTVEASAEAADLAVEARVRHQLYLVFKEALANVVHHSGASEVRLVVRVENRTLQVVVEDNGCGVREPGTNGGGHDGIANMRRRMEKLGGRFGITGDDGRGTTVTFSAPLNS
jgi:signal transduction histidine kinase